MQSFPAEAEILFKAAEENSKWRYKSYQRLAAMEYEKTV
jgi:pyruvate-ferredoxin/flavodoxin oxidoreductase